MVGLIEQEPILRLKKLFDKKEFDKIISFCHELLKNDDENMIALQNISTAYIMVGAHNDAIKYCEKILVVMYERSFISNESISKNWG